MTNFVLITVPEPVGAANVPAALAGIPGLPAVASVVSKELTIQVTFEDELTTSQMTDVQAFGLSLPLRARQLRYAKVASEDCGEAIVAGVWSNATGTNYWYDTDKEAQLNVVGAVVSGTDTYWHVREFANGPKTPVLHTPAQLIAIGQAIKAWKEERIYVFQTFRTQLEMTTSVAQCDALWATWDPLAAPVYPS